MPVERFRSVEEMSAAPIRVASADSFQRFVRHCARFWTIFPRRYPRGVFKFRTLEEAQASRARVANSGRGRSSEDHQT